MTFMISDDAVFVYGQNAENAQVLLDACTEHGFDQAVVRTGDDGFYVPRDLADLMFPVTDLPKEG